MINYSIRISWILNPQDEESLFTIVWLLIFHLEESSKHLTSIGHLTTQKHTLNHELLQVHHAFCLQAQDHIAPCPDHIWIVFAFIHYVIEPEERFIVDT